MANEEMILEKLQAIEHYSLLSAKNVLLIDEVALLTGLSKSRLYKLTCGKQIPFYKNAKMLYFDKKEIEDWMRQNKSISQMEAEQKADAYLVRKGGAI